MYAKRDQTGLARAYSLIAEMHGALGMPSQQGGIPVMVTMDMPGAEVYDHSDSEDYHDDSKEHDHSEIEMAAADLYKIAEYAPKLKEIIEQMPGLEGWVASKITKAADYISSVYHWLEYQQHEDEGSCEYDSEDDSMYNSGHEDTDECSYAASGCKCGNCSDCN